MKNATIDMYQSRRRRVGKTAKQRKSGKLERNASNRSTRSDWCQDSRASNSTFPRQTCNGRKNRFQYTGKGGKMVVNG